MKSSLKYFFNNKKSYVFISEKGEKRNKKRVQST